MGRSAKVAASLAWGFVCFKDLADFAAQIKFRVVWTLVLIAWV